MNEKVANLAVHRARDNYGSNQQLNADLSALGTRVLGRSGEGCGTGVGKGVIYNGIVSQRIRIIILQTFLNLLYDRKSHNYNRNRHFIL